MPGMMPADYDRLVTEDIRSYAGLNHPVKTALPERLFHRWMKLKNIHPNPDDEFTNPAIGPNFEIVGNYVRNMADKTGSQKKMDPLFVEKMSAGGFMLLDGHHRWLAAHRLNMYTARVRILNVTPADEIISAVRSSERRMCVSFDLDEVLLTDGTKVPADRWIPVLHRISVKSGMRLRSPVLIRELQKLGFDVWVYSGGYRSETALKRIFRFHRVRVDGMVNGIRKKEQRALIRKAFVEKYEVSLHIDGSDIVWVNTRTREYDTLPIGGNASDWGARTLQAVKQIRIVRDRIGTPAGDDAHEK